MSRTKKPSIEAEIIPVKDYDPELEEQVEFWIKRVKPSPRNERLYKRVIIPKFESDFQKEQWQREEIKRCKNGHEGMTGKMYFYFHYSWILDVERGKLQPDYRVADDLWFKELEYCRDSKEWGLVCVKRRRVGASWKEAADVLHDAMFNKYYHVGMNSMTEKDSIELFKKVKFIYNNLPDFLRASSKGGNTRMSMDFSFFTKDNKGNKIKSGTQSTITCVAPTDSAYEGMMLQKWVCDEAGKIKNLTQMYAFTEPCLMAGVRRVGVPILFGTSGEIGNAGKGLKYIWDNYKAYKMRRFFFAGWMGLIYDEKGNDLLEEGIRWIIYERKRRESLDPKQYNDFKQQFPLSVEEAFAQASSGGVGDIVKINKQMTRLAEAPPKAIKGKFYEDNGEIIFRPKISGEIVIYEHPDNSLSNQYVAGCLPAGEQVLTDSGLKNIEKVTFNDKLVSKDGEYVDIHELQRYKVNEPLYEIKVKNTFRTTKFTGEHPLYVSPNKKGYTSFKKKKREGLTYSHQKFDFNFKPVKDIDVGEWIKYPNVYKDERAIDSDGLWNNGDVRVDRQIPNPLDNIDFWWFVGLWLGDGSSYNGKVVISCNATEESTIKKLCNVIETVFNRSPYLNKKSNNCIDVEFHSKQLHMFLLANFGKYSSSKRIPEWFKFSANKYKASLVGGYIDSDGAIIKDNRRDNYSLEIVSINLEMMEHLQDILFSMGVVSSTSLLREAQKSYIGGRLVNQNRTYRVRTGNYAVGQLLALDCNSVKLGLINDFKHTRNNRMGCFLSDDLNYIYFQIIDIRESIINGWVYNFHCDTSTYICKNITSHNCDPADHDNVFEEASDMSTYILKKRIGTEPPKIVMEYTARPKASTEYYEQVLYALLYYNKAKILIENNRYRMIGWFEENGYKWLLQTTPQGVWKFFSRKMANTIGLRMNKDVKEYMEDLIEEYIEFYSEFIASRELLQECIEYGTRNTDRCFIPGHKIETIDGRKNIEDIKVSEMVLTHTGQYKPVTHLFENKHDNKIYNIKVLGNNTPISCTGNHPFLVTRPKINPHGKDYLKQKQDLLPYSWKNAEELTTDDYVLLPKRNILNPTTLSDFELYLLGWYLSDGYISKQGQLQITFQGDQLHIAEHIKKELMLYDTFENVTRGDDGKFGRLEPQIHKLSYANAYRLTFTSKKVKTLIKTNTKNKVLKAKLYNSSGLIPLLLGIYEGDGHLAVGKRNDGVVRKSLQLSLKNKQLIYQIRQILIDEGIWSTLSNVNRNDQLKIDIQDHLGINKVVKGSLKFNVVDVSKQNKYHIATADGILVPIRKIDSINYLGPVYNIEVKDDNSYICEGIATHNCMAFGIALIMLKDDKRAIKRAEEKSKALPTVSYVRDSSGNVRRVLPKERALNQNELN